MNWLFHLFNSEPEEPDPVKRVIIDNGLRYPAEDDYVIQGELEGWLVFSGYTHRGDHLELQFDFIG